MPDFLERRTDPGGLLFLFILWRSITYFDVIKKCSETLRGFYGCCISSKCIQTEKTLLSCGALVDQLWLLQSKRNCSNVTIFGTRCATKTELALEFVTHSLISADDIELCPREFVRYIQHSALNITTLVKVLLLEWLLVWIRAYFHFDLQLPSTIKLYFGTEKTIDTACDTKVRLGA